MTSVTRCISDKRNLFLKSKKYSWNACLSHLIVMYFKPQKIPFSWRILRTCLDCVLHKILDDNSKYWDQNKHETLHSWAYYLNILFKLYSKLIKTTLYICNKSRRNFSTNIDCFASKEKVLFSSIHFARKLQSIVFFVISAQL